MTTRLWNAAPVTDHEAPVYFLHIPKTAGTSFNQFLESKFDPSSLFHAHIWSQALAAPKDALAGKQLIWGHFYGYFDVLADQPLRYVTFLRDPVERALSHYGHVMLHPGHYLHQRAHALGSFGAFVRDPQTGTTTSNFQVHSLALELDPQALRPLLGASDVPALEIERRLETRSIAAPELGMETIGPRLFTRRVPFPETAPDVLLAIAKARLQQLCFLGISERYDESIQLVSRLFGWEAAQPPSALNVNSERPRREQVSAEDLAFLLAANRADIELYQYGLALFSKALRDHCQ